MRIWRFKRHDADSFDLNVLGVQVTRGWAGTGVWFGKALLWIDPGFSRISFAWDPD